MTCINLREEAFAIEDVTLQERKLIVVTSISLKAVCFCHCRVLYKYGVLRKQTMRVA